MPEYLERRMCTAQNHHHELWTMEGQGSCLGKADNGVDLDPHAQPQRISIDHDNWEGHLNVKCRQVIDQMCQDSTYDPESS